MKALKTLFVSLFRLIAKSRVVTVIVVVAIIASIGVVVDWGINKDRIYPGVSVGEVDLGGKTAQEAERLIETAYTSRITDTKVLIFASEEAMRDKEASLARNRDQNFAEQHSTEEVQASKLVWEVDAATVGATLDTRNLVQQAFDHGRGIHLLFDRILTLFSGYEIIPHIRYEAEALESLAVDIDATIGEPRIDYDIEVIEGMAYLIQGHDGHMIDRDVLDSQLDAALLSPDSSEYSFVATTEYAPLRITEEDAQQTCDRINAVISLGARFVYEETTWEADRNVLGAWLQTDLAKRGDEWELQPYFSYDLAKQTLLEHLKVNFHDIDPKVRYENTGSGVVVHADSSGTIPRSEAAIASLSQAVFSPENFSATQPVVIVETESIPPTMSFREAIDYGVIGRISEFTTEYTANVSNRNHNIHLVSDLLDDSIVPAQGGVWSFNETAGNCNEEAGFRGAGSIVDGEYVDEIGGGICQVATTVFNAVYQSGYPVVQRHNHSLYIGSYPAGRDAAVSWPDLDLRWKNDTSSDVLLVSDYTDTSVTISLYGVDPGYVVETVTGEWKEGKPFKTKTVVDESLEPGSSYTKTYGTDGSSIRVTRIVKDSKGNPKGEDTFDSVYDPKDEVKISGPPKKDEPKADGSDADGNSRSPDGSVGSGSDEAAPEGTRPTS